MITETLNGLFSGNQLLSTLILAGVFVLARKLIEKLLRGREDFIPDERRRLISWSRNALVLVLVVGLVLIWAPALRTFALSVTAFLVALVIATKELILCVTGGLLRTSTGAFSVGDWVRIGDLRGEVVDQSIMSVTLQELEPPARGHRFTGRTVTLPNSVFLTTNVVNENFYKKFVYHSVEITIEREDDPTETARVMEVAMTAAIADSREVALRYNQLIRRRSGVEMPAIEPRIRMVTTNEARIRIGVTAFVPTGDTERIDREVMAAVLAAAHASRAEKTSPTGT